VKLLLDEHLPRAISEQLRNRSHDVVAVTERPELRGLSDPDLFERAQSEQRAIATYNTEDFLQLDREYRATERAHAGIVLVSFPRKSVGPLVTALTSFLKSGAPYASFVHWLQ
jgi:hypothetical protein